MTESLRCQIKLSSKNKDFTLMHNEGMFEYNKIPTVTISSYRSDPSTGCIKSCWSNALHGSRAFVSYQFKNHALTGFGSIIHRALFVAALQDETV